MKRSKNVFLTLLVPAMAAFGCSKETDPAGRGGSFDTTTAEPTAVYGESAEKTDDEKNATGTTPQSTASHTGTTRHHGSYFHIPWIMGHRSGIAPTIPIPVGSGMNHSSGISHPSGSSRSNSVSHPATASHPTSSIHPGSSHPGSTHPGGSITHGGFGGTGSHMSGGS